MKGPIKRQIAGLGWLELGLTLAGLTVVSGLLVESGPELWDALVSQSWPARGVTGGVVVTIGVLAEVIIGAYGQYRSHWNPYFSNRNDDCIWKIAVDVARQSGINPGEIDVGHDLLHELRKAKQENSLVVLIIDTWTLKLREIEQKMREYDDTSFLNCAALVVWDESDETSEGREALANLLVEIFDDNYGTNHSHLFRPDVRSREDLVHELAETLRILKFNVINRGQPMRVIAGKNEPLPGF